MISLENETSVPRFAMTLMGLDLNYIRLFCHFILFKIFTELFDYLAILFVCTWCARIWAMLAMYELLVYWRMIDEKKKKRNPSFYGM